jgi:hypothetical protein
MLNSTVSGLFMFKPEFLKISVDLETAFAVETHPGEG